MRRRAQEPLTTSAQLNRLVDEVVPQAHRPAGNPAKRVFQALRIEVNGELDKLAGTLPQIACRLAPNGRLVVESYHSLEDKTVKSFMNEGLRVDAPADMPVIPDDAQPFFAPLTRGAVRPGRMRSQPIPGRRRCACAASSWSGPCLRAGASASGRTRKSPGTMSRPGTRVKTAADTVAAADMTT